MTAENVPPPNDSAPGVAAEPTTAAAAEPGPAADPAAAAELEPSAAAPAEPAVTTESEPAAATEAAATEAPVEATAAETAPAEPLPAPPDLGPAACGARLAELFPALFAGPPKPIKLRIQADIQQRAPGVFTKKALSVFLHRLTTSTAYLNALASAPARVDLDGAPAGDIDDEHRRAAVAELERRRAVLQERRAVEQAARRAAQAQQRQPPPAIEAVERDAEVTERHERALLLRAFETTTLTRANFCVLKGIAEDELDARLAQARAERANRPAGPAPGQRPSGAGGAGPGTGRHDRGARPDPGGRDAAGRPPRGRQAKLPQR